MAEKRLAIIGGGASCVLLVAHLARNQAAHGLKVDVYDRRGTFGRGIAYSTEHDCHLLNVRAANMSAFRDDKADFANWAKGHGYAPEDFVPRTLYGAYLEQKLKDAGQYLKINFISEDVAHTDQTPDGYSINGRHYNHAVLASGNVLPLRPETDGAVAGYFDDPWSADFGVLMQAKTIAILGSGLSAVDMVIALHARQYEGVITIFSRNAILPATHVMPVPYTSFLNEELETLSPLALLRLIKQTVRLAAKQNIPWQSVIDSMRPHTNTIWINWPEEERARFMKRLFTFWNIHRHRMAPQIADIVARMREAGKLRFVKERVQKITAGPVLVTRNQTYSMDAAINCLGYRYDEGRSFAVSARLGPPNFGDLFETTAIPEIREQAARLSDQLFTA